MTVPVINTGSFPLATTSGDPFSNVAGGNLIQGSQVSSYNPTTLSDTRRRIASQHGGWIPLTVTRSNGTTQTGGTDRLQWTPNTDITGPEFVFVNGYADSSGLLNPTGNVLPFYAALENNSNQLYPISCGSNSASPISTGGKTGINLGDGCILHSLPVRAGVYASGVSQWYRVYKAVSAGQKWPMIHASANAAWQGLNTTDAVYGTTTVDQSDQTASFAATAWGAFTGTSYAFGAVAIIAEQVVPVPVVLITGDSIAAGQSDTVGRGYIGRACGAASVAYHNNGVSGTTLTNLHKYASVPQYLARFADHVVIHALTNDLGGAVITTLAQAQAAILSAVKAFGCKSNKVWICTVLPRTTSTDSWATIGNQTVTSWEALRIQINNWLRDASGSGAVATLNAQLSGIAVAGVIDACPAIEKNSDGSALVLYSNSQQLAGTGGRWSVTGGANTTDGIHPNTVATAVMTAYVPTARFTIV